MEIFAVRKEGVQTRRHCRWVRGSACGADLERRLDCDRRRLGQARGGLNLPRGENYSAIVY